LLYGRPNGRIVMKQRFAIRINGVERGVECGPERSLLDVIREDLRLTGTKRGCGIGACGSCTVLVDGKPRRSCRLKIRDVAIPWDVGRGTWDEKSSNVLANEESGRPTSYVEVTTIEGLRDGDKLHPIQQAFIDCGAIQCGFCTPGMVLTAKALLDEKPSPTRDEIKAALRGNLCRCTGYQQIFEAVEEAAKKLKG
jgi:carbon-monoxide dehydrogenase small subunit